MFTLPLPFGWHVDAMAYEQGMLETALAAAVGNDPALVLELRDVFIDSAERHLAAAELATSQPMWTASLLRLKGLAASFGAGDLMAAATAAMDAPMGDVPALTAIRAELDAIEA